MKIRYCKYCNKKIEGFTIGQVEYLMLQHILSKHRDRLIVKEKEEDKN